MNVTIHVAGPLRGAVEGRRKLDLGLPSTADVGDVLVALFALYPRLTQHLAREARSAEPGSIQLQLLFDPQDGTPIRLKEGQRVYLVADQPRRLKDPPSEG